MKNHFQSHCYYVNQETEMKTETKEINWKTLKYIAIEENNTNHTFASELICIYRYIREGGREKPNEICCNNLVAVSHE